MPDDALPLALDPAPVTGGGSTHPRHIAMTDERLARLLVASSPSTARQAHGFVFQSGISRLLRLFVPSSYTDEVDAYSIRQPNDDVLRHSFKNMKAGSAIELGSFERNACVTKDFVLYVGFWSHFGTNIREIRVLHIPADYWRALFPDDVAPFTALEAFSGITNSRDDDELWSRRLEYLKAKWAAERPHHSPLTVNFKRDHKTQLRVQCGIPPVGFACMFSDLFSEAKTLQLEAALDGRTVPEL